MERQTGQFYGAAVKIYAYGEQPANPFTVRSLK